MHRNFKQTITLKLDSQACDDKVSALEMKVQNVFEINTYEYYP
jgi:hypothetical protein